MAKPGSREARAIAIDGSAVVDTSAIERLVAGAETGAVDGIEKFVQQMPRELAKIRRQVGMTPVAINGSRRQGAKLGYFQATLRDGTRGYFQRRTDDCIQAVCASYLQMPPHLVPDLRYDQLRAAGTDPEEIDRINEQNFRRWMNKHGLTMVFHATPPTWAKRWIGMVETGDPWNDHTLLMSGPDCLFDPAHLIPSGDLSSTVLENYTVADIGYGITIDRR